MKFHDLTLAVAAREGKKKKTDIAQINEVVSITLSEFKKAIIKRPIKGTYDVIRLIYRAKVNK